MNDLRPAPCPDATPSRSPRRRRRCAARRLRDPTEPDRHAADRLRARQRRHRRNLDDDDLALRIERLAARAAPRDRHALSERARRRRQGAARPQLDRRAHGLPRRRSEEGARRDGRSKVALVGNSRGGYPIRNFIANGGGAALVSHVVLGGVPNHGVWAHDNFLPGSEFNGAGPFLVGLNAPHGARRQRSRSRASAG